MIQSAQMQPMQMQPIVVGAFEQLATEVCEPVEVPVVEGALPASLSGVLLRNGPGRSSRGGVKYGHPFDGDGFLQRLELRAGVAHYSARFVRTREFEAEEAAGRLLYRGFGTNRPGGFLPNALRMRFKNAANTSVVQHAGRTLALWEGGVPHRFDPDTLETLGRYTYDGALEGRGLLQRLIGPELPFSAHPSICPETGELWNFGMAYGARHRLLVHTVSPDGCLRTRALPMRDLPFVHDMALTRRFAIFVLPATVFDVPATLLGLRSPVDSIQMRDAPGKALLVPRDGGPPIELAVPPGFVFHWSGGWEDGDNVVLEGIEYPGFPRLAGLGAVYERADAFELLARPVRIELNPVTGTVRRTVLADLWMELPSQVGHGPDRVMVGVGAPASCRHPFLSCVVRLAGDGSCVVKDLSPDLPGEPVVAGDHLLVPLYRHGAPAQLLVMTVDSLAIVARVQLPHPVPLPLHGVWAADG
jgi:all-trans-8'-apo-beta-carotenal 15,15'-oxygenase